MGAARGVSGRERREPRGERLARLAWQWVVLYLLLCPTLLTLAVFGYLPKLDVVYRAFMRWQPPFVESWVGLDNFRDAFADPLFWQSFGLIGILLAANLVKMWPGLLVAVALHRMLSGRARYAYQVLFVVPMVIPGLVWLLIWKSFFDPQFGLLNRFLGATGLMRALAILDGTPEAPGWMPRLAGALRPFGENLVEPVFGGCGGLIFAGGLLVGVAGRSAVQRPGWQRLALPLVCGLLPLTVTAAGAVGGLGLAAVVGTVIAAWAGRSLARGIGDGWIVWLLLFGFGAAVFAGDYVRMAIVSGALVALVEGLRAAGAGAIAGHRVARRLGLLMVVSGMALLLFGGVWTEPVGEFVGGEPSWLGNRDLIIPALILWGFPWVGTIGVFIYLSGLQQIPQDVYEAARLDGVGSVALLFRIELPLIMTQIRINLILMTIHTLTAYEFFLVLLGADGGPGNRGMVPGLYMFRVAFEDGRFGYACALGMVMFAILLLLTALYNRFVRVEK